MTKAPPHRGRRRDPGYIDMKLKLAVGLLAFALCSAGGAAGQARPNSSSAHGKPGLEGNWAANFILPLPDKIVLHTEYGDDIRVVPITDKHAPRALWTRLGDSIGRWEGATLVIETVGMPDADSFRIGPVMLVPGEATVIERLTPIS